MACDTAFDNIPRRVFGKAKPTYAVARADESTALLTSEEFMRLDLSGFVDLRNLRAGDFKPNAPAKASELIGTPPLQTPDFERPLPRPRSRTTK